MFLNRGITFQSFGISNCFSKGVSELCKGAGEEDADMIFLKHNASIFYTIRTLNKVLDEYGEQSEVAERLIIRALPLFHFYKNGVLLEAFPTRDKERIIEAVKKYTSTNQDD